jgi:hypothetical protein
MDIELNGIDKRTPEKVTRDKWASNVREEIDSCERAQWMPIARATAIAHKRMRLIILALLPPILFLTGVGLVARANKNITVNVAKLIMSIGALAIGVAIADIFRDVSDSYMDFVTADLDVFHRLRKSIPNLASCEG